MTWSIKFTAPDEQSAKAEVRRQAAERAIPATVRDVILAAISPAPAHQSLLVESFGHIGGTGGVQNVTVTVTPIQIARPADDPVPARVPSET